MKNFEDDFDERADLGDYDDGPWADEDRCYTYNDVHDILEKHGVEPSDALIKELINYFEGEDEE
jgi:hypothetical protein